MHGDRFLKIIPVEGANMIKAIGFVELNNEKFHIICNKCRLKSKGTFVGYKGIDLKCKYSISYNLIWIFFIFYNLILLFGSIILRE